MTTVIIASTNPVKIDAARAGFRAMKIGGDAGFTGVSVPSGVSDQPGTDSETLQGARTRAGKARSLFPEADFWVGIEGGVEDDGERMIAFAWVVVLGKELGADARGEARTATFQLPPEIRRLVLDGVELGHADDIVFGRSNSKQQDGAIGILTDGVLDRKAYYTHALMLALVPFKKHELYAGSQGSQGRQVNR
jgi:inosine/xanthosine triphosphatase